MYPSLPPRFEHKMTLSLAMRCDCYAAPRIREDLTDPRLWLEEVEGEESLGWVREVNANTLKAIGDPSSTDEYRRMLDILDSDEKIPYIGRVLNGLYYNFWQDENNVRGIWRRCTPEQYREEQPAWEVVLDLDALGKQEDVSWVWAGGETSLRRPPFHTL